MLPAIDPAVVDLLAAHERLRRAWQREGELEISQRRQVLGTLRSAVLAQTPDLLEALNADFGGRSRHESLLTEVTPVVSAIDYARRHLKQWAKSQRVALEWPHWLASARLIKHARGVAGIVAPFNYPLQLALMPLISALSAGCRTLVKPSEATPRTAELLGTLISNSVDPDIVRVVCGGPRVAAMLASLPLDVFLFTGSQEVGRKMAAETARHFTPTVLELGGKSPVLIDRGADLPRSAIAIVKGKLLNAGQTCVAPDYVLIPREHLLPFIEHLYQAAASLYPDPLGGDYSAILGNDRYERLLGLEVGHETRSLFQQTLPRPLYAPKLLVNPALGSDVMQQEIFGPLLPLIPYDSIEEALAVVCNLPPALVLYWFGERNARLTQAMGRMASASVSINDTVIHAGISALPLGGIGSCGLGCYHGRAGFDAFTHAHPVFEQSRFNLTDLMLPPYGRRAEFILRRLLR